MDLEKQKIMQNYENDEIDKCESVLTSHTSISNSDKSASTKAINENILYTI